MSVSMLNEQHVVDGSDLSAATKRLYEVKKRGRENLGILMMVMSNTRPSIKIT